MSHTQYVDQLPVVSQELQQKILNATRNVDCHRYLMNEMEAMAVLEAQTDMAYTPLNDQFKVLSWNLERCLFPEKAAELVRSYAPDILLLSEMDVGMARTKQRNTVKEMAAHLGMNSLYALEFFEMGLGSDTEKKFCDDDFNLCGWHGNALLTSAPIVDAKLIRLDDHGHWFCSDENGTDPGEPRVGGRVAIAARLQGQNGDLIAVSTHLESNAGVEHRCNQTKILIKEVEAFANGLPIIMAGDLNTGNHLPGSDWKLETLFDYAETQGYSWETNAEGMTTNPSLITRHPNREMKLDWFVTKDLKGHDPQIIPPYDAEETPLSDHKPIFAQFEK